MLKKIFHKIIGEFIVKSYLKNFNNSFKNPLKYYLYCNTYLKKYISKEVFNHREYFKLDQRSFGEDAFTTMWFLLFQKFNFNNFLEIGVYIGQTLTLLSLIAKIDRKPIECFGISPLIDANDSVTEYIKINYEEDVNKHLKFFNIKNVTLLKEFSNSDKAIAFIQSIEWDCIYIDGSHDLDVVKSDFEVSYKYLKQGGIIVMDDSSLNIDLFHGQFKGHPGPSYVADHIDSCTMKEFLRVGHNRCFLKL